MSIKTKPRKLSVALALLFSVGAVNAGAVPMTLKSVSQKAVLSNPEVLARYHAFKASEGELQAVTGAMLPHLDFIATHGKEDRNDPTLKGKFTDNSSSLQLTQLLWDGLGSWYQKRQFDHARLVRVFELYDASESAALEVARTYFDVLRYRKLVSLAEDNYVQHRSVHEQIEARVKAGVGRRVDFEQATGRLALAESNLLVEIANLHDVSARFQRLVGEPPDESMEYPALLSEGIPESIKSALEKSYSVNPQVRAAVENVRASAYARDSRRGAYQPKVEFRLRGDRGNDIGGLAGKTHNNVAEVLLNFNIFNGFTDVGRVDQTVELYNASRDQRDKACRDVRQTLEIAYNDVRKLSEQKTYLEQHRMAVEKARDAYRKQFDIGQRSLLDLLDTENELFQAQRAEANAELDLATAYARVHAGTGKLLTVLGLSSLNGELAGETADWNLGEESPEQCPPEPVMTYTVDKGRLNTLAAEMTREKVKTMLDAMAARSEAAAVAVVPVAAQAAVNSAVAAWASAWMKADVQAYLSSYAPDYSPQDGRTHADWAAARGATIGKAKAIKLLISGQQIEVRDATRATVRFHQSYSSASYEDEIDKVLELQLIDNRWLIVKESVSVGAAESKDKKPSPAAMSSSRQVPITSVQDAINEWTVAWENADPARFERRYAPEFVASSGVSLGDWVAQEMRKSSFSRNKGIHMSVDGMSIETGNALTTKVGLIQHFESADYSRTVSKALTMKKVPGDWKILSEAVTAKSVSVAEPQRADSVRLISLPMPPLMDSPQKDQPQAF